eukprot:NODE_12_length_45166_cov_0.552511.p13 type:complete len:279 gc:universal NODE_12_length_45166_cov_0.552511:17007-16171(-)
MSQNQFLDDFINTLRSHARSLDISKLKGLEKVISVLHQIQMNPEENYNDIIRKSSKMLNEYELLKSMNLKYKEDMEARRKEVDETVSKWACEIEKRQNTLIQLRLKRNEIVHSYRRQVEIVDKHLSNEKAFVIEQKKVLEDKLILELDNFAWITNRDTITMKKLEDHFSLEKESDAGVLDKWVNDYEKKIELQETEIENLKIETEKKSNELEKAAIEFRDKNAVIVGYNVEISKRQDAKKLIEMQVTAILLLQRWWRKVHKNAPQPLKKKPAKKKINK